MPDDNPDNPNDSSDPIDPTLNSLPVLEQSVWATLLTATAQIQVPMGFAIGRLDPTIFDFPKIEFPRFEFPRIELPTLDLQAFGIKLPEIDFDHVFRTMEEVIQQLAMRCWSLPWHLSIPEMQDLVDRNPDEIDAFFEAYFEDGALETLRKDILGDTKLDRWKVLLDQCFKNYGNGDFHICIPSLITVLEGSFNYLAFFSEGHRKKFFDDRIEAAASFQKLTWISLRSFCNVVFRPGDPRKATDYINRHKIMHGLDDPSTWKKIDCLRLFQALDSTRRLK